MALDATVAGATADSYLTVAAADALAAADVGPEATAWLDAGAAEKEQALKRATREIDAEVRSDWVRYSYTVTSPYRQRLRFPRSIDYTGTSPKVPFIPDDIINATYEQATYVHKNAAVLDAAAVRRAQGLRSGSEPDVSWTRDEGGMSALSPAALHYLKGYRRAAAARGIQSTRMSSAA